MAGFIVDYSGDLNLAFYISAGKVSVQSSILLEEYGFFSAARKMSEIIYK